MSIENTPYSPEQHPTPHLRASLATYFSRLGLMKGYEVREARLNFKDFLKSWEYDIPEEVIARNFDEQMTMPGKEQWFIDSMTTLPFDALIESARQELDLGEYKKWLHMMALETVAHTGGVHKPARCLDSPTMATQSHACDESPHCPYIYLKKTLEHATVELLNQSEDRTILRDRHEGRLYEDDFERASLELHTSQQVFLTPDYEVRWLESALAPRLDAHIHAITIEALEALDEAPDD